MKAVLISIQPKWCEKIASGEKTVDVRKTRPKIETPFKCCIYCTLPPKEELFTHGCIREYANELIRLQDGRIVYDYGMRLCCDPEDRPYSKDNFLCKKVIGEFVCDRIGKVGWTSNPSKADWKDVFNEETCLTNKETYEYTKGELFYEWHISDLVIYDKPKDLSEFKRACPDNVRSCAMCRHSGYSEMKCPKIIKAPQSWCYVEVQE